MYDLHSHSHCSDGKLSPTELVQLAAQQGVTTLALTDHDTVAGIPEAQQAIAQLEDNPLTLIPGIELSCLWQGKNIHILGLNVDMESSLLQQAVESQRQLRHERAQEIARRLEKQGFRGVWEGALHHAGEGVIGRPHFAQYLVEMGYVSSFSQAFSRYLGAGKIGDVKQCWPSLETVTAWIVKSGGIPVLAHPDKYNLTRTKLYLLLEQFCAAGGLGVEVINGKQDLGVTQKLIKAAQDFGLLISCGSDFHVPDQPWQALGAYSPLPEKLPDGCEPVWDHF